jgi:ribose 5-phosphate isomerase B
MKVAMGNDHAGFPLREAVREAVVALGHELVDFGTASLDSCDYPDVAVALARAVVSGECDLGILFCGTGIGMSIAANKVEGAYAARAEDCYAARMARLHNGANILTFGGRTIGPGLAEDVVTVFLTTEPSSDPRHTRRQEKVKQVEAGA